MHLEQQIAVQSYCFRNFKDNREVARMVRDCGLRRIELCGVHAPLREVDAARAAIDEFGECGVEVVSLGVERFTNDEPSERALCELARQAGIRAISVDFGLANMPDSLKTGERLGGEFNLRLGIHNHGGRHWLGSGQILRHICAHAAPAIGLCLDTAWALDAGEDPVALARELADRLYLVHVKDFAFGRDRKPEDVVAGEGNLDVDGLFRVLREADFQGPVILEYEGDVDRPVASVSRCREAVMAAWQRVERG
ncbi:MAG: Inosose dehydratase [candidate division BRC1 bacterium ADurb.BinA292]|nr:MAG: Inosose dehydratase [candidate division BRC1 bacterium ADurb.BinA292]